MKNLEDEFRLLNRSVIGEMFKLGLYDEEAAGRLSSKLLDAAYMRKLYAGWSSASFSYEDDINKREEKVHRDAKGVLADAISCEIALSHFLKQSGRIGIVNRTVLKLTSAFLS